MSTDEDFCLYEIGNDKRICKEENCIACYNRSFASHPKSKWWSEKNKVTPREVFKGTGKKYIFNCGECNHEFSTSLDHVTGNRKTWCKFCCNRKLCSDDGCIVCYNKSFASHPRSGEWSDKNNLKPREVFLNSGKKFWIKCKTCNHEFNVALYSLTAKKPVICAYCSNKKLCENEDCKMCFENSFASHPRSGEWSENNKISPRSVFKYSCKKYEFKCKECNTYFSAIIGNVTRDIPSWCGICKNKTEKILYNFLLVRYPDTVYQYKPEWCKSSLTKKHLSFDFFIPSLKIIIEVDGSQHFRQVLKWEAPECIQSRDLYKMKMAYDKGISVIRVPFRYVFLEKEFEKYKERLVGSIKLYETPEIVYLCDDDRYDHFRGYNFKEGDVPTILSDKDLNQENKKAGFVFF